MQTQLKSFKEIAKRFIGFEIKFSFIRKKKVWLKLTITDDDKSTLNKLPLKAASFCENSSISDKDNFLQQSCYKIKIRKRK